MVIGVWGWEASGIMNTVRLSVAHQREVTGGRKSLGTNRVAASMSFMSVVIEPMTY